jgi:hypothetical protein
MSSARSRLAMQPLATVSQRRSKSRKRVLPSPSAIAPAGAAQPIYRCRSAASTYEKGRYETCPYVGGDAGNRTRVRRIRTWIYYKHSRPIGCRPSHPRATGCSSGQPMILGSHYRRDVNRTLVFMTPTPKVPERPWGGRDVGLGRQGLHVDAYAAIGRAARFGLLAFDVLPSFNEVQAPRLAIQDQPSPSKPIIPSLQSNYTTFCPTDQALRHGGVPVNLPRTRRETVGDTAPCQ